MMRKVLLLITIALMTFNSYGQMGEWTWINGDSTTNSRGQYLAQLVCDSSTNALGPYGTQGAFDSLNPPPGLYEACEWTDKQGNFWMFGGESNSGSINGDLWEFKPVINQWAWIKGPGLINQSGVYGIINI